MFFCHNIGMNNEYVCKIKREGFIFICIIECLNLWPNFLFSKSNLKKISQNIPNNPFYLKKHMRWTRRSLSSTINSNCTKLILKKIVLTQVLIWKGHFFFVFFTFQQIFSHMSYHHISLMCILLLCIVHEKSEYYNMCDGSNPSKTNSLNTFELDISKSELTWAKKPNSKPKLFQNQTLNMFGQKWALNLLSCYKSGLSEFWTQI